MKKSIGWIVGIFVYFSFHAICFAEETVRIATGEWSPYISEKLKHYGVVTRIVTEAFALEGIKIEYQFVPWKRAILWVESGKQDGSSVWAYNSDRGERFLFSDPVVSAKYVFFHRKDYKFDWETIEDIRGKEIGIILGYTYGAAFNKALKARQLLTIAVSYEEQIFSMLLKKRVEIVPMALEVGYDILQRKFKPKESQLITHHPKPLRDKPSHLIFSKKIKRNQRLVKLFNKGLKRLRTSGRYNQYFEESLKGEYIINK